LHHATPFYKTTEIVGVQKQSAKKNNALELSKLKQKGTKN